MSRRCLTELIQRPGDPRQAESGWAAARKGRKGEMHPGETAPTDAIEVTDGSFSLNVLKSRLPVLLDCWAPWCPPCLLMAPVIEELATRLAGTVKVATLNVDENPDTAARLGIQSIPTLLLFRDGEVVGVIIGAAVLEQIEAAVLRRLAVQ
jgi:thioredoxin 1